MWLTLVISQLAHADLADKKKKNETEKKKNEKKNVEEEEEEEEKETRMTASVYTFS